MDHIILFHAMRDPDFPRCYINIGGQLYKVSGTDYTTPRGNTLTIHIHRDTFQRDTLSSSLFPIYTETLLRWLSIGSIGYKPKHQINTPRKHICLPTTIDVQTMSTSPHVPFITYKYK